MLKEFKEFALKGNVLDWRLVSSSALLSVQSSHRSLTTLSCRQLGCC